jgi:signal transduction histidine kinase
LTDAAADPALPGSAQRALQQRVDQVCAVLLRNSVPVVAADLLLAYAVAGDGLLWPAATWFVLIETSMLLRRRLVVRHTAAAGDPAAMMRQLVRWSALQGLLRAPIVVLAFGYGSSNTQVMVTMVMVGLAAGAVATCGGETRIFRNWSLPALGSLVVAWALQWNLEAATVALLLAYLHHVLAGYVAVLGVQGQRLLDYSAQLELERDRVREANVALEAIGVELRAERDRAAEANAAKTRVLASVSHDLRQPLFALSLNTAALGDLLEGSADTQLQRVESGLRRSLDQCPRAARPAGRLLAARSRQRRSALADAGAGPVPANAGHHLRAGGARGRPAVDTRARRPAAPGPDRPAAARAAVGQPAAKTR